ncbi:MAG: PaaI family thioesterase [Parvularculaceae bacterium]|nr:PaaI family thioesterase [Parvularculaceae bacterium]
MTAPDVANQLNEMSRAFLPGLLGVRFTAAGENWIEADLEVRRDLMAPNGFLHAGTVVTLADTCCGVGCARSLPGGATGFTTIELKSNFLGTAKEGAIACRATAGHLGRTTQLWDAVVTNKENGRTIALFRCTQLVLWPKPAA